MVKNKDRWSALSMTERADLIKLYVDSGITSLDIIKKDYNSFAPGGPIETDEYGYPADITPAVVEADYPRENEVWKRADASTADIIQRLKQGSSRATIPDHKNPRMVATHKMMSAGNYVVGNVQNINGQLFDFTDPKHGFKNSDRAAIDSAIKRGDYVEFDTEGDARYFAEHYKKYYNGFGDGGDIDNFDIEPAIITGTSNLTNAFFKDFSDRYYNYHNKNIEDKVQKVLSKDTKRNKSKTGVYYNPITDGITLSPISDAVSYTHELTHKLNNSFPKRIRRTRSEKKLLKGAYPLGNRYDAHGKLYGLFVGPTEYFTTNTELRRRISQYYGNVTGNELNDVINNMSDEQLAIFAGASGYNSNDDFYVMPSDITDGKSYYNKYRLQYEDSPEWEALSDKQKELMEYRFKTGLGKRFFKTYDENRLKLVRQALINVAANGGKLNKFATGGPTEGGWSEDTLNKRKRRYGRYDPVGGLGADQLLYMFFGGNHSSGEENEYWKAYLGLDNNVPKMNPNAKTSWDDKIEAEKVANGELPSDFYGTTPKMDLSIQAIADTLNTGNILRNYDEYKNKHEDLPSRKTIERIYNTGKRVLENPNTWQQVDGDNNAIKKKLDIVTNESNPIGMLANFGMMWNPEEKALYMHDTYDFPGWTVPLVGDRPKEMKIRSKISFDPKKGSVLLRDELKHFNKY